MLKAIGKEALSVFPLDIMFTKQIQQRRRCSTVRVRLTRLRLRYARSNQAILAVQQLSVGTSSRLREHRH